MQDDHLIYLFFQRKMIQVYTYILMVSKKKVVLFYVQRSNVLFYVKMIQVYSYILLLECFMILDKRN
jgi:hypothetical protein